MIFTVKVASIPKECEISKALNNVYYQDCYRFNSPVENRVALQIWLDHASQTPTWVNLLMNVRNNIVFLLGLKNLGRIGEFDACKPIYAYQIGDEVGIFTLIFLSENEVILEDSDKHLDVKISIYRNNHETALIHISSVVHVHNWLGKLYMLFVKPMHKIIVPSSIIRAETA